MSQSGSEPSFGSDYIIIILSRADDLSKILGMSRITIRMQDPDYDNEFQQRSLPDRLSSLFNGMN